jgi:hypothetical protein
MDDGLRLVFLLAAGVLPLMALRDRLSPRMFRLLAGLYVAVAVAAVAAWFTVGPARPPVPQDVPFQAV